MQAVFAIGAPQHFLLFFSKDGSAGEVGDFFGVGEEVKVSTGLNTVAVVVFKEVFEFSDGFRVDEFCEFIHRGSPREVCGRWLLGAYRKKSR